MRYSISIYFRSKAHFLGGESSDRLGKDASGG